jgi:hypothetical protein
MARAIWKRPCINLFITYFARAGNMLLPFTKGQIACYCPHKTLLPQRQITRRKLCFYYTCKFGVISIKYVIKNHIALQGSTLTVVRLPRASEMRLRASENGTQLVRSSKWKWFCDMFNSWRAKWLILNYSVLEVPANFT